MTAELLPPSSASTAADVDRASDQCTDDTVHTTAFGVEARGPSKEVRFWGVTKPITQLIEARQLPRLNHQLAKLDPSIQDLSMHLAASKLGAELLFDIISTACERTSLRVGHNLPFEHWMKVLGSERLKGTTLDRLTHRRHSLDASGECCRLANARHQTRKPSPHLAKRNGKSTRKSTKI